MDSPQIEAARILVVDDDAGVRQVLRSMLLPAGYEVEIACNGREAIQLLQTSRFDLVITDLVMPEQEGIETIKLLRRDFPSVKIIAISGAFGGDYLRIAGFLGAHRTMAKPVRMETVIRVVEETLRSTEDPPHAEGLEEF
ncbi:MAG: response regulator [Bryobacteraceae bacterium]|nr:response regulator [Bryobacteraceae bacterium]